MREKMPVLVTGIGLRPENLRGVYLFYTKKNKKEEKITFFVINP